jgi:hypothetical protein
MGFIALHFGLFAHLPIIYSGKIMARHYSATKRQGEEPPHSPTIPISEPLSS